MKTEIILWLVKQGWLKLSIGHVIGWSEQRDYESLVFAMRYGQFKVRAMAAVALGKTKDPRAPRALLSYLDDPVHLVSLATIQSLELFNLEPEALKRIKDKKVYWQKEVLRQQKQQANFKKRNSPHEFASWKQGEKLPRLEEVRQMLKRPIRWG